MANLAESLGKSVHDYWPLLGLARSVHRNRRGKPMSFEDKPYLIPLYAKLADYEGEVVFQKGVQTGHSELLIVLALYHAGWRDRIVGYTLPTYGISERFVSERVDRLLQRVPAYAERVPGAKYGAPEKGSGSMRKKKFGRNGSILFLGSNTDSDFEELSADTMIVDEYDSCDWSNTPKVKDRVQEGVKPLIVWSANPRRPGGIEDMFLAGTQDRWFHKCDRCGERQALRWEDHFVDRNDAGMWVPRDRERAEDASLGDLRPVCRRCGRPWDRTRQGSAWVSAQPSATWSLHVSRLDVLSKGRHDQPIRGYYAEWVKAQGSTQKLEALSAALFGERYASKGSQVTSEAMASVAIGPPIDYNGGDAYDDPIVVAGIDVGSVHNMQVDVIDGHAEHGPIRRTVWAGTVGSFEGMSDVFRRYRVDLAVIDAFPETTKAKELVEYEERLEGGTEVWMCQFSRTARVGREAFAMVLNQGERKVTTDRTQLLDTTLDEYAPGRRILPSDYLTIDEYSAQMRAPVRILSDKGRFVWDEGGKADHYRLSDAYSRVAAELWSYGGGVY